MALTDRKKFTSQLVYYSNSKKSKEEKLAEDKKDREELLRDIEDCDDEQVKKVLEEVRDDPYYDEAVKLAREYIDEQDKKLYPPLSVIKAKIIFRICFYAIASFVLFILNSITFDLTPISRILKICSWRAVYMYKEL